MKFITIFDPKNEINFIKRFKMAAIVSFSIIAISIVGLLTLGMPWGIDFLGGVEMQVKFKQPVDPGDIRQVLENIDFDKNQVQQFGPSQNNEMLVRVERMAALQEKDVEQVKSIVASSFPLSTPREQQVIYNPKTSGNLINIWLDEPNGSKVQDDPVAMRNALESQKAALLQLMNQKTDLDLRKTSENGKEATIAGAIVADDPQNSLVKYTVHFAGVTGKIHKALQQQFGEVEIRKVDFVDSQVSQQLRTDGLLAVIYAIIAIFIYIAIRFDVYFSPGAIFALINDTFGALMVFVFFRVEFDTPSIAAMLTIIGYSINNTIVVYDRIRETVPQNPKKPLSVDEIKPYVNKAINDTLSRTINTTITTLCASIAVWIFATGVIENFAMVLTMGIIFGAFSSVFIAPSVYLFTKKYLHTKTDDDISNKADYISREDKAKGVV